MRSWVLPLVVSLLLHAALFGGAFALSSRGATTAPLLTETRIVQLIDDEPAAKPTPAGPSPQDFEPHIADSIPVSTAPSPTVGPPVLEPPYVPGGNGGGAAGNPHPGTGTGNDAGSSLFVSAAAARRVVYVLDRSGSMGRQDAYHRACAEVLVHIDQLSPTTRFQVVPYNSTAQTLCINAATDLLPIDADTLVKVKTALAELRPTGWTNHLCGLKRALLLSPDVLYLVTDADDLTPEDVKTITTLNRGRTVIHTIEMHARYGGKPTGALSRLATDNKGTYRRVVMED